jgi:hypothetical protein
MPETTTQVQPETTAVQETEAKTPEQIEKEIAERYETKYKAELAGMNKAVAAQKKLTDELLAKTMTAEELAQKKINDSLERAEQAEKKALQFEKNLLVNAALNDAGIPLSFAKRIIGDSEDDIKADIKELKDYINSEIEKGILSEGHKRFAQLPPISGASAKGKLMKSDDFNKLLPKDQAAFMSNGGILED